MLIVSLFLFISINIKQFVINKRKCFKQSKLLLFEYFLFVYNRVYEKLITFPIK